MWALLCRWVWRLAVYSIVLTWYMLTTTGIWQWGQWLGVQMRLDAAMLLAGVFGVALGAIVRE